MAFCHVCSIIDIPITLWDKCQNVVDKFMAETSKLFVRSRSIGEIFFRFNNNQILLWDFAYLYDSLLNLDQLNLIISIIWIPVIYVFQYFELFVWSWFFLLRTISLTEFKHQIFLLFWIKNMGLKFIFLTLKGNFYPLCNIAPNWFLLLQDRMTQHQNAVLPLQTTRSCSLSGTTSYACLCSDLSFATLFSFYTGDSRYVSLWTVPQMSIIIIYNSTWSILIQ